MNPLLFALFLTGPWRPLPSLEAGNPQPVINSLNDMLGDHWLELPLSRPGACDGPCAEVVAPAAFGGSGPLFTAAEITVPGSTL